MTVSILTASEAETARRVWRDRWLADVRARASLGESDLPLAGSLVAEAERHAERWWKP